MVIKKSSIRILPVVALLVLNHIFLIRTAPCEGCFSIVVGKNASVDGYVIMAHNEDDPSPQIVNHHKIPHRKHSSPTVSSMNGASASHRTIAPHERICRESLMVE
jgi:hypothetical protein